MALQVRVVGDFSNTCTAAAGSHQGQAAGVRAAAGQGRGVNRLACQETLQLSHTMERGTQAGRQAGRQARLYSTPAGRASRPQRR